MTTITKDATIDLHLGEPGRAKLQDVLALRPAFDAFLQARNVSLTLPQERLCALVLDAAARDVKLLELLTLPATGASFLLALLDDFFTQVKHSTRNTRPDWPAHDQPESVIPG